ncbi:MAG TPA: glycosyltransferase, partial [Blastocatellia bacterium]|nr:glycosyltransferase [Blastocatellia bacterium]
MKVLYIVYWGAAEPLGQSLVLPAVSKLADLGAELTLVTFEKPQDLARGDEMGRIRDSLDKRGVKWIPLRYHKQPKVPATVFDIINGAARGILARLKMRPDIIHARTFIGGMIGMAIAPILRSKLIYHNEGFYPDEQVDAGVWKMNSAPHRVAKRLEEKMYSRADGIIAMSNRGKMCIEDLAEVRRKGAPVIVVPSCVDLDHFRYSRSKFPVDGEPLRLVYSGSVGGRYHLDHLARFVAVAADSTGPTELRVLTRSDHTLAESLLRDGGLDKSHWSIESLAYSQMPGELAKQHAGLHFLPKGISEHGGSPTKIGEYWAAGLPVVVTPNAGDTDEIIRSERVGVIVDSHSDDSYRRAAVELVSLLKDSELPRRCRGAAETHYALESACHRQYSLYNDLVLRNSNLRAGTGASELSKL